MTPNRNPLVRLSHVPQRFRDERERRVQRAERDYVEHGYLWPKEVRSGALRDRRLEEINRLRFEEKIAHVLRHTPGPLLEDQWSARRINTLARDFPSWRNYLEIGIFEGRTLEQVRIHHRVGVDPQPLFDLAYPPERTEVVVLPSDEYFASIGPAVTFDMAFADGLHTAEQTYRDIINVFAHLPAGPLLIDDTVPLDEISAIPDQVESYHARDAAGLEGRQWHGDVWRTVVMLDRHHPELEWRTITDRGNPQTLVWRRQPGVPVRAASGEALADVMTLTYRDVFANGTPAFFKPVLEDTALVECVTGLRGS